MIALLDVNVLIALFDPVHVHHEAAHAWFADNHRAGWATCPTTESGLIRIPSHNKYKGSRTPAREMVRKLDRFRASGSHHFWPDSISLYDPSIFCQTSEIGPKQVTDIYLLGLAKANNGRLVTFDRKIPLDLVVGAELHHLLVLEA